MKKQKRGRQYKKEKKNPEDNEETKEEGAFQGTY